MELYARSQSISPNFRDLIWNYSVQLHQKICLIFEIVEKKSVVYDQNTLSTIYLVIDFGRKIVN